MSSRTIVTLFAITFAGVGCGNELTCEEHEREVERLNDETQAPDGKCHICASTCEVGATRGLWVAEQNGECGQFFRDAEAGDICRL